MGDVAWWVSEGETSKIWAIGGTNAGIAELSAEQMRLIGRVANLQAQGRMILLIDPAQLLDQVEAAVLARFDRSGLEQPSTAS